jgi:hypothetical protein
MVALQFQLMDPSASALFNSSIVTGHSTPVTTVDKTSSGSGEKTIWKAAAEGDNYLLESLLDGGVDINDLR